MTEINDKFLADSILIGRQYTNITNDGNILPSEKRVLKEGGRILEGLSVSDGIKKSYGISHLERILISELNIFSKHPKIINTIDELRCFTFNYLCGLLERADGDKTVKRILSILVRREILLKFAFIGKSKRTYVLYIYHTHLATKEDVQSTIKEYVLGDDARHKKDEQRKKDPPKTAKEVTAHNDEMIALKKVRLAKEKRIAKRKAKKMMAMNLTNDECCPLKEIIIQAERFREHSCGKGTVRA